MFTHYYEILERAAGGAPGQKNDSDLEHVIAGTRRVVKQYEIVYDKSRLVPNDPALAERVFAAALDLAEQVGVYCISSGRVIRFSRQELQTGLERMPAVLVMGEGKDARALTPRGVQDERPPLAWGGNPGAPIPEDLFLPTVLSWMQEPLLDLATCGSLTSVDGLAVETGKPGEVLAVRREMSLLHQGLKRAGRPGMGLLGAQSSVSELGNLAAACPGGLRPCDAQLVAMFNELMMDHGNMTRAVNSLETGVRNASLATVMVGGLAGGPAGAAVVQAASFILANLVCRADYHLLHPIHIRHVATSTPEVLWVQSLVAQAFAHCAPCIIVVDIYPKSGALTPELLYEVAANAAVGAVSGGHLEGVGSADGALPNGTGLEARWMAEVGRAVSAQRMTLDDVNALGLELLARYRHVFTQPGGNPGVRFDRAYDPLSVRPLPAWLEMYEHVKNEVRGLGLRAL